MVGFIGRSFDFIVESRGMENEDSTRSAPPLKDTHHCKLFGVQYMICGDLINGPV